MIKQMSIASPKGCSEGGPRCSKGEEGVAKVCRAALRREGIEVDDLEREGYLGDPSVKGGFSLVGKGDALGKFNTAHGVFAFDGHIFVANREAHQVIEFTPTVFLTHSESLIASPMNFCCIAKAHGILIRKLSTDA